MAGNLLSTDVCRQNSLTVASRVAASFDSDQDHRKKKFPSPLARPGDRLMVDTNKAGLRRKDEIG